MFHMQLYAMYIISYPIFCDCLQIFSTLYLTNCTQSFKLNVTV